MPTTSSRQLSPPFPPAGFGAFTGEGVASAAAALGASALGAAALATRADAGDIEAAESSPTWLEYVYRTAHPALRWLLTKLAEWIGENLQDELGFADKADKRAAAGSGWTPAEPAGVDLLLNLMYLNMLQS